MSTGRKDIIYILKYNTIRYRSTEGYIGLPNCNKSLWDDDWVGKKHIFEKFLNCLLQDFKNE